MNILIIGGMLGLAVVAILGAVLLGISEDRAERVERAQKASVPAAATALLPQQSQSRQRSTLEEASSVPATPALARPTIQLPPLREEENLASLNGQAREIIDELRTLALRAGELEQHLNLLSDRLERQQVRRPGTSGPLYASEIRENSDS